ncbi:MAG: cysteine hydrolase family protein [Actinomycetota bacterium]
MNTSQTTAVVVIEMQNDLCSPSLTSSRGLSGALARAVESRGVIERLQRVLADARARGIHVMYATKERHPGIPLPSYPKIYAAAGGDAKLVHGTWGADVVDGLKPEPADVVLPRFTSIDPSHGSELWAVCERLGVERLALAGISTSFAVEGTARGAANRGYRVVVLEDCCAGVPDEWHRFSVENILPLIAEVTTSDIFIASL